MVVTLGLKFLMLNEAFLHAEISVLVATTELLKRKELKLIRVSKRRGRISIAS